MECVRDFVAIFLLYRIVVHIVGVFSIQCWRSEVSRGDIGCSIFMDMMHFFFFNITAAYGTLLLLCVIGVTHRYCDDRVVRMRYFC